MRIACLPVLFFATFALGQVAENVTPTQVVPSSATGASPAPAAAQLAADVPVIVINGLCDSPAKEAKPKSRTDCKTIVTRAQFDALAEAVLPSLDPTSKAQLAASYSRSLLMQREFRKRELESNPKVKQALEYATLRAESDEVEKAMKDQSSVLSDAEIQKYYNDNAPNYAEAELLRLYVPFAHNDPQHAVTRRARQDPRKPEEMAKPDEPMKATAAAFRARATAGESFDNLQAEAYQVAGFAGTPPDTNIGKHTAAELSDDHRPLISMAVNEVSQVLSGPNGYYIYKVISKDTRSLDQVHSEITTKLGQQKFAESTQKLEQSAKAEFNSSYFRLDPLAVNPAGPSSAGFRPGAPLGARNLGGRGRASVRSTLPSEFVLPNVKTTTVTTPASGADATH